MLEMMVKREMDEKEKDVTTILSAPLFRLGRGHFTFYSGGSVTLSHSWDDASKGEPLVGLASLPRPMDGINGELG